MSLPYYISWTKQKEASTFEIERVDGALIHTSKGQVLIDMTSISYQAHFGHNHPIIIESIKKQLDTIPMSSPKGIYPHKTEATLDLLTYMEKKEGKIFYTTGGAESVENALKIARDITKKKIVLARKNSYHGATLGALSATGDWRNPAHMTPEGWVIRIPEPNESDALLKTKKIILENDPQNIAAIIVETITGGNGVYAGTKEWWIGLRELCDEFSILLILDEVVCGFHRTGKPFAYMHYGIEADMICLAKGISGGMVPFGAVWTNQKIADYYEENILCCGLTNYAHPLGIAAMRGVLEIVNDQNFQKNLKLVENIFSEELQALSRMEIVKDIRVQGMLAAIDLKKTIDGKKFMEKGIYLVAQTNRIILAPPLIISEDLLKSAMSIIAQVLEDNH